jgi:2-polyprenyl-6-methoxyphenol hydroxylase-like FAD-dependent oxidoreductase
VVGADGVHSGVRRLAFGDEQRYVRHLGYYLAGWDLPNTLDAGATPQYYNVPGRAARISGDRRDPERAGAFVVFASPRLDCDWHDTEQQKGLIATAFAGLGWHVPHLLDSLGQASELYFDSISKVTVPRLSAGRVVLLGDAAWGVTLGGMGVGTGVVGAYVLAGELAAAPGDHGRALAAYENRMRGYAKTWQRAANPCQFLAPSTAARLRVRNVLLSRRLVQRMLVSSTKSLATDLDLPEYAA